MLIKLVKMYLNNTRYLFLLDNLLFACYYCNSNATCI